MLTQRGIRSQHKLLLYNYERERYIYDGMYVHAARYKVKFVSPAEEHIPINISSNAELIQRINVSRRSESGLEPTVSVTSRSDDNDAVVARYCQGRV